MGDEVSTSCLINLALDLSTTWKMLARALALEGEVERIEKDYRYSVSEQAYRMLLIWKQGNGSSATLQVLGEALKKPIVSRKDLAQKYCENDNPGSWEIEINLEGQPRIGEVSKDDMNFISKDLGKDWLWVGRVLGIENAELDDIRDSDTQLYECSYQMLQSWARKNGDQATYECLARALLHRAVGKRDIAEKYCFERQHPQGEIRLSSVISDSITTHCSVEAMPTHHVMLSYQTKDQPLVERVYQGLRHLGINTWMDIHGGITGNINDSMACGVERAAVICCFMTRDYFNSNNCKKELNYADDQSKTIVPVMCEKGFKAEGWLGIITAGLLWIDFRDGTVFENSLQSLVKEILNALHSEKESAIKLNDPKMSIDASAAPVTMVNFQKKPGRAFVHKLTGKFLADSGQVKLHPDSDSRSTVVMRDLAEDTSYWIEERTPKSEIQFFKNYATNRYLGMDGNYIYTKAQHCGAEEWILKADDQSTDGQRAVVLWNNFGKLYLAIRNGKLVAESSYAEDCVWILD